MDNAGHICHCLRRNNDEYGVDMHVALRDLNCGTKTFWVSVTQQIQWVVWWNVRHVFVEADLRLFTPLGKRNLGGSEFVDRVYSWPSGVGNDHYVFRNMFLPRKKRREVD